MKNASSQLPLKFASCLWNTFSPQRDAGAYRARTGARAVRPCLPSAADRGQRRRPPHLQASAPEDLLTGASLVSKQWRRHTKPLCAEWKQELLAGETTLNVSGLC